MTDLGSMHEMLDRAEIRYVEEATEDGVELQIFDCNECHTVMEFAPDGRLLSIHAYK